MGYGHTGETDDWRDTATEILCCTFPSKSKPRYSAKGGKNTKRGNQNQIRKDTLQADGWGIKNSLAGMKFASENIDFEI